MVFGPVLVDSHDFEGEGRSSARPPRPVSSLLSIRASFRNPSFSSPPVVQRIGETKVGRTHHRMVLFEITSGGNVSELKAGHCFQCSSF